MEMAGAFTYFSQSRSRDFQLSTDTPPTRMTHHHRERVSVWLRETTGSFVAAFLLVQVILISMAAIIWFCSLENTRKELDQIAV